jgi:hypothetical protein
MSIRFSRVRRRRRVRARSSYRCAIPALLSLSTTTPSTHYRLSLCRAHAKVPPSRQERLTVPRIGGGFLPSVPFPLFSSLSPARARARAQDDAAPRPPRHRPAHGRGRGRGGQGRCCCCSLREAPPSGEWFFVCLLLSLSLSTMLGSNSTIRLDSSNRAISSPPSLRVPPPPSKQPLQT